ncbi:MAG: SPFH domain-containing protein [Thermoguttaceae bacterium]
MERDSPQSVGSVLQPKPSRRCFGDERPVDDDDDEDAEDACDHALGVLEQDRRLHCILIFIPTAMAAAIAVYILWQGASSSSSLSSDQATTLGVLCLAFSCLCLILSKPFAAISSDELPEAGSLAVCFREMQWAGGIIAVAVFAGQFWTPAEFWGSRLLLLWTFLIAVEQIGRVVQHWPREKTDLREFVSPLRLAIRNAMFIRGNPVAGAFDTLESQWGISFRSSWAIRFVRRAVLPVLCLAGVLLWSLSSLSLVGLNEMGIRESFGRMDAEPLKPGLQWKLSWPFGRVLRFPVKQVTAQPVGFTVGASQPMAYLWTKAHSKEEFALVLGDGTEAVAVNAMIYYKIREDREGFLDYALGFQNPDAAIETFAYRVLMEQTRNSTLKEVLSANRAEFAEHLRESLRAYAAKNRLGIDVIDVALLNLHPPIEAAADYLAVISARIDANRYQIEANAERLAKMQSSEKQRGTTVATAKVDAERRVGLAAEESAKFIAIGNAFSIAPDSFKLRSWFETFEDILSSKPLMLIDKTFTTGPGEILLDLRTNANGADATLPGGKKKQW